MIVKTKNIEKIKTSDEESGVFSFSEEAYRIFRSIVWKGNIQKRNAILILSMIYGKKKNDDDFKYLSSSKLKNIYDKYTEILNKLSENNLITIVNSNTKKFYVNKNYVGFCKLSNEDASLYRKSWIKYNEKLAARSYKSNTTNFNFDVEEEVLNNVLENALYEDLNFSKNHTLEETIKDQKRRVKNLSQGKLKPRQNTNKRCYSEFTGIVKDLHKFLTINNQSVVEIDSHATFLTFLPTICKKWINKLNYDIQKIQEKPEFDIDNLVLIEKINKKSNLLEGALEDIKEFESFLEQTFNNNQSIYEKIAENIEGYDTNNIKKSMNSYLMSQECNKTDKRIDLFFMMNFPKIRNLLDDMRHTNYYWRKSEEIEVSIFSNTAKYLMENGINTLTKYDGIFVEKSKYLETLEILHNQFQMLQIHTLLNVVDQETGMKSKLNEKNRMELINTFNQTNLKDLMENIIEDSCGMSSTSSSLNLCTGTSSKPATHSNILAGTREEEEHGLDLRYFGSSGTKLSDPWEVSRSISITTLKDGRFRVSIKDKKYNSRKNETKYDFYKRLINDVEITEENKKLIKFEEIDQRENIVESVANVDVTQTYSEPVFSSVVEETITDTETLLNLPVSVPRGVSVDFNMDVYKSMILGNL